MIADCPPLEEVRESGVCVKGEVSYNTPTLPQTRFTLNYESAPLHLSFRFNISLTPPKCLFLNV